MEDQRGREISYMRISVTDRCNLRCKYCMPEGIELLPMDEILTFEEILQVCRQAIRLGITRFKITGGEPLVRKGCTGLIRELRQLPGVEQVTMTTNGVLLSDYLDELADAGLNAVNVSLDTLNRERYQEITGFDRLDCVIDGIQKAIDYGMKVKVNAVLQAGKNEDDWRDLLELSRDRDLDVRFIELMPIGFGQSFVMVSNRDLFDRIQAEYQEIRADESLHGNGPAVYYRITGFRGSVGFVSAMHGKFCGSCNRIRMTSTGGIKPCLCYEQTFSVRDAVRVGNGDEVREILERAIREKPGMHCFESVQNVTEKKKMVQIGG